MTNHDDVQHESYSVTIMFGHIPHILDILPSASFLLLQPVFVSLP